MAEDLQPTPAEQKLIDAAAKGEIADYRVGDKQADDPANGAEWGEDRTLRAEILYDLCVGARPEWKVHAKGVQAFGARITGSLDFSGAELLTRLRPALCHFDQPLFLRDARTQTLAFDGSHCQGMNADGLVTKGNVFLRDGFTAEGEVRLVGADIGGSLECDAGKFKNPKGIALNADGLVTKDSVYLRNGFIAEGEVRLLGANIGGDFGCRAGEFKNSDGNALAADRMVVKGGVFLDRGFTAEGEVRLLGAEIGGELVCHAGEFKNPGGHALAADRMVVKGSVFLRCGFTAEGEVRLVGADIGSDLNCRAGEFKNAGGHALNAQNMKVAGALFLDRVKSRPYGRFDFGHAKVGQLYDDVNSWPEPGKLVLDGFVYDAIAGDAPTSAEARLRWLRLQPTKPFKPQPYEQLIRVLRRMGHERDAREVAIAKQDALRKSGELGWWSSIWRLFLGVTIGYGYKPWKAFIFMAVFLMLGMAVFYGAGFRGLMMPTQAKAGGVTPDMQCATSYPCFHAFMYSVDTFIPIIDFHQ